MDKIIGNINYNINQVESILDNLFNEYENGDFENISCIPYIYKGAIRFAPVSLKDKIDALYFWLVRTETSKKKILSKKK